MDAVSVGGRSAYEIVYIVLEYLRERGGIAGWEGMCCQPNLT